MTTTDTAPATDIETDDPGPGIGADAPTLAELIAERLCCLLMVDGRFIRLSAAVEDDGRYIALDVARLDLETEHDLTARVLLHLSEPVVAAAVDSGVETESGATR